VYTERSDHPLDKGFDMHRQMFVPPLSASCILSLDGMERQGACFRFAARGYDVYRTRVMGMRHTYDTGEGIPWERMTLCLDWLEPHVFRVRCGRGEDVPEHRTPMLVDRESGGAYRLECREFEDRYEIASSELRLLIFRNDFRIEIHGPDGPVTVMGARQRDGFMNVVDTVPLGFVRDLETGRSYAVNSFELAPGEAVFGFGEHYGTVNRRGQTVSLWTEEGMGHSTGRNYKNIPFFMSTSGYGVFVNESLPMTFFVGSRFYPRNELAVEGDLLDLFFFHGPSLKRVQEAYTALTGRPPMVPRWSLGLWVSRISYLSQEEVLEVARRLRKEQWPSDVIHLDTGWFEKDWQCDWRFDPRRFPDPGAMIRELHAMHFRLSLWQWPYLVDTLPAREEAEKRGALAAGEVMALGFRVRHIDFTRPEGVAWYQEQLERLFGLGVDVIKTDFGEYVEDHLAFRSGSARSLKNLYPLLYNRAAFQAAERRKKGEALLWARSAYAGSQRYPVHWSGDSACTFQDMPCALRGGLSLGLSGFTFWSNDVGGVLGNALGRTVCPLDGLEHLQLSHATSRGASPLPGAVELRTGDAGGIPGPRGAPVPADPLSVQRGPEERAPGAAGTQAPGV
jgi:alpha-D-xyloside xylohydrolase